MAIVGAPGVCCANLASGMKNVSKKRSCTAMAVSRYNMLVSPFTLQSNGRWCDNAPAYGEKTGIGCFAMRVTNKLWKAWRAFMLACSKQKLLLATLLSIVFCHHTSPQMYHDMVMVLSRGYTYHLITYLRLHSTISSVRKSRSQVGTVTGCHRASMPCHPHSPRLGFSACFWAPVAEPPCRGKISKGDFNV